MTKRNQDFDMHIGESKTLAISVKNEDGSDFIFTGATVEWWLAKTSHSPFLIRKTLTSGIAIVTGGVEISLESEETYDLKPEVYYHELKIVKQGVSVSTVGAALLRHALDMRETPTQVRAEPPPVANVVIPRRPADASDVLRVTVPPGTSARVRIRS